MGTTRYLNAHATVSADGKPHYRRAKLLKVVAPLVASGSDGACFVITDAIPISQKRCPKGGKDEGLPIVRLYAAASAPISSSPASRMNQRTCSRGCAARLASPQESEVRGANAGPRPGDGSRRTSPRRWQPRQVVVLPSAADVAGAPGATDPEQLKYGVCRHGLDGDSEPELELWGSPVLTCKKGTSYTPCTSAAAR